MVGGYVDACTKAKLIAVLRRQGITQPEWIEIQAKKYVGNYERKHGPVRAIAKRQKLFVRTSADHAMQAYLKRVTEASESNGS